MISVSTPFMQGLSQSPDLTIHPGILDGTVMDLPDEESIRKTADILKEARDKISSQMGYERG